MGQDFLPREFRLGLPAYLDTSQTSEFQFMLLVKPKGPGLKRSTTP